MPCLACIVEGQGEVESIPLIVRRIAHEQGVYDLKLQPYRIHRQAIVRPGELERAVDRAARSLEGRGGVLIVLDADDDLPCELGPILTQRAREARQDIASRVVLATREKEAWYLAAAESLRDQRGLPPDLQPPANPEAIRGAKEWLSQAAGRPYSSVADEPALAAVFSMERARERSPSFARLSRIVGELIL